VLLEQARGAVVEGGRQHVVGRRVVEERDLEDLRDVAAREGTGLQAQVGRPQVPAERWIGLDDRVGVHRDGEFVDRRTGVRARVREQTGAVDHHPGVAHRAATGSLQPGEADRQHRDPGGLQRAEPPRQREAAADRAVDVLVQHHPPRVGGACDTLAPRVRGARGALHRHELHARFREAGRSRDVQLELPGPVDRDDHGERRHRPGARQLGDRPLRADDDHLVEPEPVARGRRRHAERLRGAQQRVDEGPRGRLDAVRVAQVRQPAAVQEQLERRRGRVQAHVGAVEQPHRVVAEVAGEHPLDDARVHAVGQAADEPRPGRRQVVQRRERGLGLHEVLEQVADDDRVEALADARQPVAVDVAHVHRVEHRGGAGGRVAIALDAGPAHAGVSLRERLAEAPAGAPELEHVTGVGRDRVEELSVQAVVVGAHRRPTSRA
jgi:hypothetical protein